MQLQTSSRALRDALATVSKAISNKNALAILDFALLRKIDGKFLITGASTEAQLTVAVDIIDVKENFTQVCLPVAELISYLSLLPDVTLTLDFNESNHTLTLSYCTQSGEQNKGGKVSLAYNEADEYPLIRQFDETACHIVLPGSTFLHHINAAMPFTANDDLRMVMNGVCLDIKLDTCTIVATDGHTLYRYIHHNGAHGMGTDFQRSNTEATIILGKHILKTIAPFAGAEEVEITTDNRSVTIKSENVELIGKLIEGRYPNYNSVIPQDNSKYIVLDSKEISQVIKRVSLFSAKATNLLSLQSEGMFLNLRAEDIDFSRSASDQALISDQNSSMSEKIGVKASKFLQDINACNSPSIRIEFMGSSKPLIIRPDEQNATVTTLCMPMLLGD